jgi:hypothetical protein
MIAVAIIDSLGRLFRRLLMELDTGTMLVATVAFCGSIHEVDLDRAADELQQAGFEVHRLPRKYRKYLAHPLDDMELSLVWRRVRQGLCAFGGNLPRCL